MRIFAIQMLMSRAIFYDLKKLIVWLYFSENMTLYDEPKMT